MNNTTLIGHEITHLISASLKYGLCQKLFKHFFTLLSLVTACTVVNDLPCDVTRWIKPRSRVNVL